MKETVEIMEPDAGDGRLSTEQQSLYEIARALAEAFRSNGRSSEISWRRSTANFDQTPRGSDPRLALEEDEDRKTLN